MALHCLEVSREEVLYGGNRGWDASKWQSSDDSVRGGKSHSSLKISNNKGCFSGVLDKDTLGGAGFASQRTSGDSTLNLSEFDGLQIRVAESDAKVYTLILKDEKLPKKDGREQATTSYEHDFVVSSELPARRGVNIQVLWKDLKPTYRGKEDKTAQPLNPGAIKQINLMNRSFFGKQDGPFSLTIMSISAFKKKANSGAGGMKTLFPYPYRDFPEASSVETLIDEKAQNVEEEESSQQGLLPSLASCFGCGRRS